MIYNLLQTLRDWLVEINLWRFLQVFQWIEFRTLCALVCSFLFVLFFGRYTIKLLVKFKIGDHPEFNDDTLNRLNEQKTNTPTMGGILIASAIGLSTILFADMTIFYIQMGLICLVWMTVLGGVDDWLKLTSARRQPTNRDGLYSWEKFLFQIALALLLGFFVHHYGHENPETHVLMLPFQRTIDPRTGQLVTEGLIFMTPWAFGLLTIMVVVGTSNAVNLTDGMDGLASGVMGIISFAFTILSLIAGNEQAAHYLLLPHIPHSGELAVMTGAMCGACLGFLWFNCYPAQIFMGDTGSLPLGGLIGYIAVVTRHELLLVIIGGILVAEALSVILQVSFFKLTGGSRIFYCAPLHHHFHKKNWTETQIVVRFWLITALLTAIGLASLKIR